jgi:hypothetical protein
MALSAGMLPLLTACVVVPQTTRVYDPACGVATKQIVLDVAVLPGFYNCRGAECPALTVASAVVSGSVAVIGNVLYWAERRGQCPPGTAPPPA